MAEIAITSVINKAVDMAAGLIIEEGSRLYQLQENIIWIEREMRHIQSYLEDAEAMKSEESHGVANLIKEINDLAQDTEDILDMFLPKIVSNRSHSFIKKVVSSLGYARTCRNLAMEIEKIKKRVDEIDRIRRTYGIRDTSDSIIRSKQMDPRGDSLHVNESIFVGLDEKVEELKAKMLSTNLECCFISIAGMPGLGKTTLAKKVFTCVKEHFECSAVVCVSQKPSIRDILRDVAKQVGLEREKQEEQVEANLCSFLSGKRFVIFFDDIWDTETWDALKLAIPIDSQTGSRIIVTSRNTGIGRYVGSESSLQLLQPLDFKVSWELFTKLLPNPSTKVDHLELGLEQIGKQIVERCGGVPLAIVVTVGMLREREMIENEWRWVLNNMSRDYQDKCSKILALSYKDLPTPLKPCFLYLGLYPEDHEIPASHLIRMWTAEKFLKGNGEIDSYDVGEEYIKKLAARNLIQVVSRRFDGRIRSCRIHDLLHNLCINVAKESSFFHILDPQINANSAGRMRRIVTRQHSISKYVALNFSTPRLRAFFSSNNIENTPHKRLKKLLSDFRLLGVLNLEFSLDDLSFPEEIGNLRRLTYFRLKGLHSGKLPSTLCRLKELQTLDVQECMSISIPMCIWKIKELKHLLLCVIVKFTPCNRGCKFKIKKPSQLLQVTLPNLQTLVGIDGNSLNPIWLHNFSNLRKLEVRHCPKGIIDVLSQTEPISEKLENLRIMSSDFDPNQTIRLNLSRYPKLIRLRIGCEMKKLPNVDKFPPNLVKLTVVYTKLEEDPMEVLKKLPKLKVLKFGSDSYEGKKMDCSGPCSFPQLELLQIRHLWELEELAADEGMPKLKEVIISHCHRLEMIPEKLDKLRKSNKLVQSTSYSSR